MKKRGLRKKNILNTVLSVNLTPLIDIALTLLIIFMLSSPIMHREFIIDLPLAQMSSKIDNKTQVSVRIDKKGNLSINGKTFAKNSDIEQLLLGHIKEKEAVGVSIEADLDVPYGKVVHIVDQIKMLQGIEYVSLATQSG